MTADRESLPLGTVLGDYRLCELLAQGGFSLIYLADVEETGEEVVIKEFMPKRIARRDARGQVVPMAPQDREGLLTAKRLFFTEVMVLASLRHPNIVRVLDFFLANQTGYLVMPNECGRNLGSYVQERHGHLSTAFLLDVFMPVLDALALLHKRSLLHLDVKPGNIHLRHGDKPLLLDLGAVRSFEGGSGLGGQVITAGYSPLEQYLRDGNVGPWTDVYAVGASMRACMEGRTPPPATDRHQQDTLVPAVEALKGRYPEFILKAVDWSMRLDPTQRPQDAGQLLVALSSELGILPPSRYRGTARDPAPSPAARPRT